MRLQTRQQPSARTWEKGEAQLLSAKDQALRQVHTFEAVAEVVKSLPKQTDRIQQYRLRLTGPEYRELFD